MTRRFEQLDAEEFAILFANAPMTRDITEVHLHHTWRPRQKDYDPNDGEPTILAIWRHHTQKRGFADIAQHVTVAPDGTVWLGRSFDRPPASAVGFNGSRKLGPFMIEMIGDFDQGRETPTKEQMAATHLVIRAVQHRFDLDSSALRFHSEMSAKTCPGETMDKARTISSVEDAELPGPRSADVFDPSMTRIHHALLSMPHDDDREDRAPAELDHGATSEGSQSLPARPRGPFTSSSRKARAMHWRDHWISLEGGAFSDSGVLQSSQADVDRIFKQKLPAAITEAKAHGEPLRLMIYAHGGLVPEDDGVDGMLEQIETWDHNRVYPLYFIWETAFFPSLLDALSSAGARGAFTDGLVEGLARYGGGRPGLARHEGERPRGQHGRGGRTVRKPRPSRSGRQGRRGSIDQPHRTQRRVNFPSPLHSRPRQRPQEDQADGR